jgi:TonB family protein
VQNGATTVSIAGGTGVSHGRRAPVPALVAALSWSLLIAAPARAQDAGTDAAPGGDGAVDAGDAAGPVLTRAPRVKQPPAPVYPPEALTAGISADVALQIDIDADGAVTAVVVTAPGGQGFDEAAEAAARAMTFEPAEIDGRPAAIRIAYVMRFRPPGAAPPVAPPAPASSPAPQPDPEPVTALVARGHIREKGTRDPITGAEVGIARLAPGAAGLQVIGASDERGNFAVQAQPGDRVRVTVSSPQHEPCIQELTLPPPGAAPLELACTVARHGRVYETVVEAPRRGDEVTRHTLTQAELTSVPGSFGDPLRVIQNLPGVARSPYGLGLLLIRGADPLDSGVYIDGHKVPLLYHFALGPSILTPDLIDRIDFYPGGFGVRYGRSTAGVIDVATRTTPLPRVHGAADVDFLDAGGYLEGPVGGGWSAAAAARRSYVDALLPAVLPDSETVAAPVYWDYQARLTRDSGPSRRDKLSLFAFGSSDSLDVVSANPERGDIDLGAHVAFHRVIASWTRPLGGGWVSRLSPGYGYDELAFRVGQADGAGSAHVIELREDLQRTFGKSATLAVGLDGELRFDQLELNVPVAPERRTYGRTRRPITNVGRTLTNLGTAAYAELLWDLVPGLRVSPGLRLDWFHYAVTDRVTFDPRVVVRWVPAGDDSGPRVTAFKLGAGVFHQPPQPFQLDDEYGNPELPIMWADQYHLGIEQGFTREIGLDATLYYLRRHNMPVTSTQQRPDGGPERYAADGRGRAYGLELLVKHRPARHLYGWIAYTLSRAEEGRRRSVDEVVPGVPYRPTEFDQTHNLIAVLSRRLGAWELGGTFRVVTGIPETPVLGAYYDSDYNTWDAVSGEARSIRRQTFHQLDLRVERGFTLDVWKLTLYLDVKNVYNAENPEATLYDYRYRERGPVRGLPILPNLGLRGTF